MRFAKKLFGERNKVLAWLSLVAVLVLTAIVATPVRVYADEEDESAKYSMYKSASFAAVYFDKHRLEAAKAQESVEQAEDAVDDGAEGDSEAEKKVDDAAVANAGDSNWHETTIDWTDAGGLLGFPDPDYDTFFMGFFSQITSAEISFSYDALSQGSAVDTNVDRNGVTARHYEPFREYVMYGRALQQVGVDETASAGIGDLAGRIGRVFLGVFLFLTYLLCSVADFVFWGMVEILRFLNPFEWMIRGAGALTHETGVAAWDNSAIKEMFTGIYDAFFETVNGSTVLTLQGVIISLAFVALISGLLLSASYRQNAPRHLRVFAIKVVFIVCAIPMLGGLYTNVIDYLSNSFFDTSDSSAYAWSNPTKILMSTVVDFEDWAKTSNLSLPDGTHLETTSTGGINLSNSTSPKTLARKINEQTYALKEDTVSSQKWTDQLSQGTNLILSMLGASDFSEAAYETEFKAKLDSDTSNSGNYTLKMLQEDMDKTSTGEAFNGTGDDAVFSGTSTVDGGSALAYQFFRGISSSNGQGATISASPTGSSQLSFKYDGNGAKGIESGLSPMSMYNYLASDFKDGSVSVYSSHKLTSAISRITHKSVNVVGESPIHKGLNGLVAITEMFAVAAVGLCYGFGMFKASIKNMINLLTSVPLAMFGLIKFISKVILCFVALIGEIILTIILYVIVSDFIMLINEAFTVEFFQGLMDTMSRSTTSTDYGVVYDAQSNAFLRDAGSADSAISAVINWAGVPSAIMDGGDTSALTLTANYVVSALGSLFLIIFNVIIAVFAVRLRRPIVESVVGGINHELSFWFERNTQVMPQQQKGIDVPGGMPGGAKGGAGGAGSGSASAGAGFGGDLQAGMAAGALGTPMIPTSLGGAMGMAIGGNMRGAAELSGDPNKMKGVQAVGTLAAGAAGGIPGLVAARAVQKSRGVFEDAAQRKIGSVTRNESDGTSNGNTIEAPEKKELPPAPPVNTKVDKNDKSNIDARSRGEKPDSNREAKASPDNNNKPQVSLANKPVLDDESSNEATSEGDEAKTKNAIAMDSNPEAATGEAKVESPEGDTTLDTAADFNGTSGGSNIDAELAANNNVSTSPSGGSHTSTNSSSSIDSDYPDETLSVGDRDKNEEGVLPDSSKEVKPDKDALDHPENLDANKKANKDEDGRPARGQDAPKPDHDGERSVSDPVAIEGTPSSHTYQLDVEKHRARYLPKKISYGREQSSGSGTTITGTNVQKTRRAVNRRAASTSGGEGIRVAPAEDEVSTRSSVPSRGLVADERDVAVRR